MQPIATAGYVNVDPPWTRVSSGFGGRVGATYRFESNPGNVIWPSGESDDEPAVRSRQNRRTDRQENRTQNVRGRCAGTFPDYAQVGVDYNYVLALYVARDRVHLIEAAGPKAQYLADLPEIRKRIPTVRYRASPPPHGAASLGTDPRRTSP
jgi:hypothetical protein